MEDKELCLPSELTPKQIEERKKLVNKYCRIYDGFHMHPPFDDECSAEEINYYLSAYWGESGFLSLFVREPIYREYALRDYYEMCEEMDLSKVNLPFELTSLLYGAYLQGCDDEDDEDEINKGFLDFLFNYYLELPLLSDKE